MSLEKRLTDSRFLIPRVEQWRQPWGLNVRVSARQKLVRFPCCSYCSSCSSLEIVPVTRCSPESEGSQSLRLRGSVAKKRRSSVRKLCANNRHWISFRLPLLPFLPSSSSSSFFLHSSHHNLHLSWFLDLEAEDQRHLVRAKGRVSQRGRALSAASR